MEFPDTVPPATRGNLLRPRGSGTLRINHAGGSNPGLTEVLLTDLLRITSGKMRKVDIDNDAFAIDKDHCASRVPELGGAAVPGGVEPHETGASQDQTIRAEKPNLVPEACAVTRPPEKPFVPPSPYPNETSKYSFWFGSSQLWTFLPTSGTWEHLGHYTPDDPTFRAKMFWFAEGYDWRKEPEPKLVITGRRLDGPSPPLLSDHANNGWTGDKNHAFMVVGINFPKLGCWEIRGRYHDAELKFVIWVAA